MGNAPPPPQASDSRGLAPAGRMIDRHAPYRRIATEEAWNIPEVLEAQVRLLAGPGAPDDPSLRMAGMFSTFAGLQRELMDIGEARIKRMDELGIAKQLLLLTAPAYKFSSRMRAPRWRGSPTIVSRRHAGAIPIDWRG